MQNQRPIAYHSQALKGKSLALSTYEKELLALVVAVKKWRPYLLGRPFVIKTDHQSLKYLLEQKIGTPAQQKWITKLLGYAFLVEYKHGKENLVADALSRKEAVKGGEFEGIKVGTLCIISFPTPTWLDELKLTYTSDAATKKIILAIQSGSNIPTGFTFSNDLLFYKGRLFLGSSAQELKAQVLQQVHASPLGCHSGYLKSFQRLKKDFYWTGMVGDLKQFVKECDTCQRLKNETCLPAGLLQPLAIPDRPWLDISMDFVEGLHKSQQKSVVFVVVDRFTKYVHFIPLAHPYTAAKVAQVFMQYVFKLHGMPSTIVSDRDPVFTSKFWSELMKLQGANLTTSSSYHPQSDGQTEVVNKSLEHYLRAFAADRPHSWVDWLPMAEFWFNTNFHTSIKLTPFEALYGYPSPKVVEYVPGVTRVAAVDSYLQDRQQLFSLLKHNLNVA